VSLIGPEDKGAEANGEDTTRTNSHLKIRTIDSIGERGGHFFREEDVTEREGTNN
jgi:hypothetical protein